MDKAKQHWKILQKLGTDLANKVREFMVIGWNGDGVIVATEDGQGFWLGQMEFEWDEKKTSTKPTPLEVSDLVQMVQGDQHILLLNKKGEIYAMGKNDWGQFGLGTANKKTHFLPKLIPIPHKFISVRCGGWHSVALTDDGKVWAWEADVWGQIGIASSDVSFQSPHQIPELDPHRVVAVECGSSHSLALTDRGEVYSWEDNYRRQLGYGTSTLTLSRITTPSPVQSIAAGHLHTLLLTQTGEVWACGDNGFGQLGLPTTTQSSRHLVKVEGLPSISQIAAHPKTNLSVAMSFDKRCFVWGELLDEKSEYNCISISTLRELPPFYSTVESPLSFYSTNRNTPHSVSIPATPLSKLSARMSRMFDNPETSPDVQFVVEQRTIHAHRIILSNSSDYFVRMFSKRWLAPVDPEDPIVRVTITGHSYQVFYAFLHFLYTDCLEVHSDSLPKLFKLASKYLVPELQKLCISRMRTTLTPTTCCLYYPLTHRHSLLPELATFQQELVQFASTRLRKIARTAAYQSMKLNLRKNLTKSARTVRHKNIDSLEIFI